MHYPLYASFSFANATPSQLIAFFGFGAFTIGFFIWVAYLHFKK
jgi:hypothetical protein